MPFYAKRSSGGRLTAGLAVVCAASVPFTARAADAPSATEQPREAMADSSLQPYTDFFEQVYAKMDANYYHPLDRSVYNAFLEKFRRQLYPEMKSENKPDNYIKWRSSAYLVEDLKASDDIFSAFMPPKAAKQYEETVLGKRIDLGIEGRRFSPGYLVTRVEPRSDAFERGLRPRDIIVAIDAAAVADMSDEVLQTALNPLEGANVALNYLSFETHQPERIEVTSREYFKQTVFMIPVDVPGVYCLQIQRFNRKTSEDLTRYMQYILRQGGPSSLILDLRGNPGGPPLAAREIASFFLPPNEEFAYFKWKDKPPTRLFVPEIPPVFHYKGDIVILVNRESGSASELFTGVLQQQGRASVMGTNSAGQVFLKSMFYFDDDSMVLLVTARGHHPDGTVFSYEGITPDERVESPDTDLVKAAAEYLVRRRTSAGSGP